MNVSDIKIKKPPTIINAEIAFWLWVVWTSIVGVVQAPKSIADMMGQFDGVFSLDPHTVFKAIVGFYILIAVISGWLIVELGKGKKWARSSAAWGVAFEALCFVCPPSTNISDYLLAVPDYGLQLYGLYVVYTKPGSYWFEQPHSEKPKRK
jgi:hypothetical protein